jgi:hypothetical protein
VDKRAAPTSKFVTPRENNDDRLDAVHGESHVRYRTNNNIWGGVELVPVLAARNLEGELHLMSMGESSSFSEAE